MPYIHVTLYAIDISRWFTSRCCYAAAALLLLRRRCRLYVADAMLRVINTVERDIDAASDVTRWRCRAIHTTTLPLSHACIATYA